MRKPKRNNNSRVLPIRSPCLLSTFWSKYIIFDVGGTTDEEECVRTRAFMASVVGRHAQRESQLALAVAIEL